MASRLPVGPGRRPPKPLPQSLRRQVNAVADSLHQNQGCRNLFKHIANVGLGIESTCNNQQIIAWGDQCRDSAIDSGDVRALMAYDELYATIDRACQAHSAGKCNASGTCSKPGGWWQSLKNWSGNLGN